MAQLRSVTCHMGSHSVTCYLTQVNTPHLNPSHAGRYSIYLPGGMEGWVDLVDLIAPRPGVEPATFRSRVWCSNTAPPRQVDYIHWPDRIGSEELWEKNWSGASAKPNMNKKMELAWTHVKKKWWQHHQTGATVDTTKPQRKRTTKEYLEKRSAWERNVDSRIQVQLEEDRGSRTTQSWMETSGLWTMFYHERQDISKSTNN